MKIFGFVKKLFFIGLTILSDFTNVNNLNAIPLSCISMNNQACKARPHHNLLMLVSSNNPIFYPLSMETSRCCGNCTNINNP